MNIAVAGHDIKATYGHGVVHVAALDGVSFELRAGSILTIIGPSGCGKTTLLRCVAGLMECSGGCITFSGSNGEMQRELIHLGFDFQDHRLLPWRTARGNIELALELTNGAESEWTYVDALLGAVGLSDFDKAFPHELSGGMQCRVALARAIVTRPEVLLLDEPLSGLDLLTRTGLMMEVERAVRLSAATTIVVTHSIEEAVFWGREVMVLSERPGRVREIVHVPGNRTEPARFLSTDEARAAMDRCRRLLLEAE